MPDRLSTRVQIGPVKPPPSRCSRRSTGAAAPISLIAPDQPETTRRRPNRPTPTQI